jgi:peroxiredoxin
MHRGKTNRKIVSMPVDERSTASYDTLGKLRMDNFQKPAADNPAQPKSRKLAGIKSLSESRIERNGLKPGSVAPEFTMPDVNGRSISLDQYRGRRVLLVFSDPHCGPCNELAPHLARAYRRRRASTTEIVVVSRGEIAENWQKAQAHGFEFPVVVQDRWKLSKKYGIFATPVAFLIGEDGRTKREVAVGVEQIRNVLRGEFTPSRVERLIETVEEISETLSNPMPRRHAFRVACFMIAGAFLSAIGMPTTALAACSSGLTACGTACCNNSTERCCNAATNTCCSTALVCCNGKCCAPGQVCQFGTCHQQSLP